MQTVLDRKGQPSKYDHAPYGTICRVSEDVEHPVFYIQRSSDEEHPQWEFMGPLIPKITV